MMKKTVLYTAMGLSLAATSMSAHAGLSDGTLLTMDPATYKCVANDGVYPDCNSGIKIIGGSFFAMGTVKVGLNPGSDGGIVMGVTQPVDTQPIDTPWIFFCNAGWHYTTTAITVIDPDVNNDGGFTQSLDLSGWTVTWNGIPEINIGGVGTITCSLADCAAGSTYALDYATLIPSSPDHGFGGTPYTLALRGTISAVPVPAAVWLFGSGLLGLVGVARRKKTI